MNLAQRSFAGGELAPALYGRTDLVKYATGLRTCRNFFVHRYGGVSNRAGTEYCASTKNNGAVRYERFLITNDQAFLLVFGDRWLRWIFAGSPLVPTLDDFAEWANGTSYAVGDLVVYDTNKYYCIAAHTSATAADRPGTGSSWASAWYPLTLIAGGAIYEIPTPYVAADLATLQVSQEGDVLTITHRNYAPRELRRVSNIKWLLSTVAFGPSIAAPTNVTASGGDTATDDTYYAVTAVSEAHGDEGLSGTYQLATKLVSAEHPATVGWDAVPGALTYNIYRSTDGQTFGFIGQAGGVPTRHSETTWDDDGASASTASVTGEWVVSGDEARMTLTTFDHPANQQFIIAGRISVSTLDVSSAASGRIGAYYARDGEPRVFAGYIATLSIDGTGNASQSFAGSITVPDNGYTTVVIDLVPEVLAESGSTTFDCSVSTATSPDNEVSWRSTSTGFKDTGVAAQYDIAPPTNPSVFAAPDDYPAAVGGFQQRRVFASTTTRPAVVRASRTAVPASFTTSSPIQDDDALSFDVSSQVRTEVRHLRDLGRLVLFGSAGEWIAEGDNSNILKPNAINVRQYSAFGASSLPPIRIGSTALFVQARRTVIRDLTVDTVQGISSRDLSVFAAHLFDGYTVVDWDFSQIPHGIAWAVRSDGVLLGLTYLPEQDVWGWHRHDTDGVIENVRVIPEGDEDRAYLCVRRTIDGETVRYIERMAPRTITAETDARDLLFMDAALTYDGRNTSATTMTLLGGSAWDEGETLTLTASTPTFIAAHVGSAVFVYDETGAELLRLAIEAYTNDTTVTVRPNTTVPSALRGLATTGWGLAAKQFTNLDHLEGKAVSIVGDGAVVASPNNAAYPVVIVTDGVVAIDPPSVVVHVGLPYVADLETLDIDTAQGPSLKPFKQLVNAVTAVVEKSRAFWAGAAPPTGDDPLEGLDLAAFRDVDDDYDLPTLKTGDYGLTMQGRWNTSGRVFLRQPDPVPTTILALIPQGLIPPTN